MAYELEVAAIDKAVANPGMDVAAPLQAIVNGLAAASASALPPGGDAGDVLTKDSTVDNDTSWTPPSGEPVLISQADYDLLSPPDPTTLYAIYPADGTSDASTTVKGIVELATSAEAVNGTDTARAVTPAGLAAAITATSGGYLGLNGQTGTTYTIVLTDDGKLVTLTNAAAVTVTLPQDSAVAIPVGHRIDFVGLGVGLVTFAAGTGATAVATPSLVTRARYSAATAIKIAANSWLVVGDLA